MSETTYSTNQNSSDIPRATNHSSSNEKTAVLRNNVHEKECARQKQRIDDQRRELVRQLSRDEAEMRHLLHELTLDRNAKPLSGSHPDSSNKELGSATDDEGTAGSSDVTTSCVLDPYPITFPCRLGAAAEAEPLHRKLCRLRATEGSTIGSSSGPATVASPASNPHPKLCRQPSSPALLAAASSSLKSSLQDESQVWVGDPLAIGSVRRPLKSPTKFRTGQLADLNGGDDVTSSVTSISGVILRKGQNSNRNSSRPQSCSGRLSDHGDDNNGVLQTSRFDSEALERKLSDSLGPSKPFQKDFLPQIGADVSANGQQRPVRSPDTRDRPRLGSDPPSKTKRKPLAKMVRQKSMQEILLHRSILNYAEQQRNEAANSASRAADSKTEPGSVSGETDHTPPQKLPTSQRSAAKSRSSLDDADSDADTKPKRQFQISAKGLARTRHGSLKDRYLKDIQESSKETSNQDGGEEKKKSGCRRTKSLKVR